MTQQEKDKIIKLLDERLPPFHKFGRAINANSILSVNEQDILYDTVKSYSEEEMRCHFCLNRSCCRKAFS